MIAATLWWMAFKKAAVADSAKAEVLESVAKWITVASVGMLVFGWIMHAIYASDLAGANAVLMAADTMECDSDCRSAVLAAAREAANAGSWLTWANITMIAALVL